MLFNHVFVGTNDIDRARIFYDAVMGALGIANSASPDAPVLSYRSGEQGFATCNGTAQVPMTLRER